MKNQILPLKQFISKVKTQPDQPYLHQPINGVLTVLTWAQVDKMARSVAQYLLNMGNSSGDRIGILSKNCAEWFISDIAIMMAGMISVPIYPTANRKTIDYVLKQSQCQTIFIGKLDDLEEVEAGVSAKISRIIYPYPSATGQFTWENVIKTTPLKNIHAAQLSDTYTIAYTSGSTGNPKGVVLSHENIASAASTAVNLMSIKNKDRLMSYLPLAHITERSLIESVSFYSGCKVFFVESLDTFIQDIKTAQPNLFMSVPRLWNKFQIEILNKIPNSKLNTLLNIPILGKIIAKKIRKGLGLDKARLFGSGTAPISPSTLEWYLKIGVPISEGWGMTESSGLSCSNFPFVKNSLGSIGKPIDCVEMKIGDNQEILIRGPAVFKEYYLNPDATQTSFTNDWFHTGDMGSVTPDGIYQIIGRVKEQFKTAKGKYVAPAPIENLLSQNNTIEQVCVIGSGRKQPIALVVLAQSPNSSVQSLTKKLDYFLPHINSQLESHQRLDHLVVLKEEWTIENGLLTPTMKIKRNEIESSFNHYLEKDLKDKITWQT